MKFVLRTGFHKKMTMTKMYHHFGFCFGCLQIKLVKGIERGDRDREKKFVVVTTGHDRAECYSGKVHGLTVIGPIFYRSVDITTTRQYYFFISYINY